MQLHKKRKIIRKIIKKKKKKERSQIEFIQYSNQLNFLTRGSEKFRSVNDTLERKKGSGKFFNYQKKKKKKMLRRVIEK